MSREPTYRQRQPSRKHNPILDVIAQDKAIKLYFASHTKPDGTISAGTIRKARDAAYHFLTYLNKPITDHAISDLITAKKANPADTSLEEQLTIYKTLKPLSTHQSQAAFILGIFRKNFAPLQMSIHISSSHKTQPISEPILLAIRNDQELTDTHRDLIDLMAHGAERITALTKLPLGNVRLIENTEYATLDIPTRLAKTGIAHPSIIPKKLAEKLLERATANGYKVLIPNSESLFKHITKLAANKYHVKLTSHYFRKRFQSIAERIPADKMSPNHWTYLMGSQQRVGHLADIYSLKDEQEIINEYHTYLAHALSLDNDQSHDILDHHATNATTTTPCRNCDTQADVLQTILTELREIKQALLAKT